MSVTWRVPGRIELFGKHTDYCGGRVLVCAVDPAVTITATPGGETISASSAGFGEPVRIEAGSDPHLPPGHWARYVQTVVDRLTSNFGPVTPCHLDISSDLPPASGMSSSSAMICGTALALADLNGFSSTDAWTIHCPDRLSLAGYLACVENGRSWGELTGTTGVGTRGGSEDHTAMLCGEPGRLLFAEFDPLRTLGTVTLPDHLTFVVAVSGVLAEKTGAAREAYNRGPAAAASMVKRWNERSGRDDPSLAAAARFLIGDQMDALDPADPRLDPLREATGGVRELRSRLDHFLAESLFCVPAAAAALALGDLDTLGYVSDTSQELSERLLGNQIAETVWLASKARTLGAHAASAFGAGFGGSVWALVDAASADAFASDWLADYRAQYPQHTDAATIVTRPGASACRVTRG